MNDPKLAASQKQTLVEDGTRLKGALTSSCPILVQGSVEGDVSGPSVTVSASGAISGKVTAGSLKSDGRVGGEIDVDSAELTGTVESDTVVRATSVALKLSSSAGKVQLTFGNAGRDGARFRS